MAKVQRNDIGKCALRAAVVALVALAGGCLGPRYVSQAALGQFEILRDARPIAEVVADPRTEERTRALLQEVPRIRAFVTALGLDAAERYTTYLEIERGAAVWFVNASQPLAFEPKTWCFPIAGCFPGLGWFDLKTGIEHRDRMAAAGWDAYLRGASAYSTGGWFDDPVFSTMIREGDEGLPRLVNVLIHELVHANFFIPDQPYYNESVAAFIGDEMTRDYLTRRFGGDSAELATYLVLLEEDRIYGAAMQKAYEDLDALYASDAPEADKLRRKQALLEALQAELGLIHAPNNASIIGWRAYALGFDEMGALLAACGRDWRRFLAVVRDIDGDDFSMELQEDFGQLFVPATRAGCPAPTS